MTSTSANSMPRFSLRFLMLAFTLFSMLYTLWLVSKLSGHESFATCWGTADLSASWYPLFSNSQLSDNHNDRRPSSSNNHPSVIVVYSGPTSLPPANNTARKPELYLKNFEHFLRMGGVNCQHHDTVIVLTADVAMQYQAEINHMNQQKCEPNGHFVRTIVRQNKCVDMESVRLVIEGDAGVDAYDYDYFITVNCGMTGPAHRNYPWSNDFIQYFGERIRMVGISHTCYRTHSGIRPHVQSMAYALDRVGLKIVTDNTSSRSAIYDCGDDNHKGNIIERYEVGMTKKIISKGFAVHSILRSRTLNGSETNVSCTDDDIWKTKALEKEYGQIPSINQTLFFKTSRVLTPEIVKLINYSLPIQGNW